LAAFRDELGRLGWTEGRNIQFNYRWAAGDLGRIEKYAKELVGLQPDVIVGRATPVTLALMKEGHAIPIVFVVVSDPVGDGIVKSLARPGGRVTGFTNVESSLGGKWVQLLREVEPRIARVGVLFDPKTAPGRGEYYLHLIEEAAKSVGAKVIPIPVHDAPEIERALKAFARESRGGLIVPPDITTANNRKLIAELATRHRIIAIFGNSFFADDGGLIAYGIEYVDLYRRAAGYVDRILRGGKAGDLPVQAPTTFELVINLKSARALGVKIPQVVLGRADRLIE
jgi:putative ABC transport system substrate-binding protein